jgi:hypothetical protein
MTVVNSSNIDARAVVVATVRSIAAGVMSSDISPAWAALVRALPKTR